MSRPENVTPGAFVKAICLLCEFAHAYSLMTSVFKSTFQPLVFRRCYKRANIAIGHKILHSIFFMFARRKYYWDFATDDEALSLNPINRAFQTK